MQISYRITLLVIYVSDNTELVDESDTDSEFDEVIDHVVDNTYIPPQNNTGKSPDRYDMVNYLIT